VRNEKKNWEEGKKSGRGEVEKGEKGKGGKL